MTEQADGPTDVQAQQQQVIIELLEECRGLSEDEIEAVLRHGLTERGLTPPPSPWLRSVASEIAADHLYVVGNGSVPNDYFSNPHAERAGQRVGGHHLQPSEETRREVDDEGEAPGNQLV
ncbi:hypothetical protein FHX74_000506 [Friedmanniella endophytica]|uniref:Uncharacterized protein n=1 Tax=Microlunatus kandeliicorticis TaxID=1759536 RepID=A0A7W3P4J9_9ACTN|nr:hypothetical protein [Microlunatus kandeliicorticis]MBA8792912.1 hypothetical protein [Microlunatus kandeliicorticis]